VEKYLFSDNIWFPAEVQEYHGTGLIGQFLKIDFYSNKLNNQLGNETHCQNRSVKKTQITLLVFSVMSENALLIHECCHHINQWDLVHHRRNSVFCNHQFCLDTVHHSHLNHLASFQSSSWWTPPHSWKTSSCLWCTLLPGPPSKDAQAQGS